VFAVQDILVFGVLAGVLASGVLWVVWRWSRARRRFLIAGLTTFLGFVAWNLTLNATSAVPNFDVDAPIVRLSWADAGSGVLAVFVTVLVLGLVTDREEPALRVIGAAVIAGAVATGLDLFVL
jgi:hypothetical protein